MNITKYLVSKGGDPNAKTAMGRTALLKATWNGEVELVKVLLEHPGMNINQGDSSGRTALHMAVWGRYGGRLRKKASINPEDSPECALLMI